MINTALSQHHSRSEQYISMPQSGPIRVLQVVGQMNPGGIESWLLHLLHNIDRDRFQVDFWVHAPEAGLYDPELEALGSRIFVAPRLNPPWRYAAALYQHLARGRYDVVHSHVHHFSGVVLRIAQQAGVPCRIAHSHLDTTGLDQQATWKRRLYLSLCRHWIASATTVGLSASDLAAIALFGAQWQTDPRWQILHCGVNLQPFQVPVNAAQLRAELGIPKEAWVIGHVGRFETQKNHAFLVQVFAAFLRQHPQAHLLLIGQGSLQPQLQALINTLGIADHVILAGVRRDVPQLMQGVMNQFCLPSLQEGLPLVLMEAQAAGLPCVIADTITTEVEVVPGLIQRCSLTQPLEEWVTALEHGMSFAEVSSRAVALKQVEATSFNIQASVQALESLYHKHSLGRA